MHCDQVGSISDGYRRFQTIAGRYTSALATRCFAFEPTDRHTDDTKGCIMIPNDETKLDFYLAMQMGDLVGEIVGGFGEVANQIEKRQMISGPTLLSPLLIAPTQNVSSTSLHPPPTASPMPSPLAPLSTSPSTASISAAVSPSRDTSQATLIPQDSTSSMLGFGLGQLLSPDKTKKRTPGRIAKLVGDLWLLCGRVDLAVSSYNSAIDTMKSLGDYQWQGAATENLICAQLIALLKRAGFGPSPSTSLENISSPAIPTPSPRAPLSLPTYTQLFAAASTSASLRSLCQDLAEKYRDIINLHDKAYSPGQPGYYPYLQICAYLDMANYTAAIWAGGFNGVLTGGAGFQLVGAESKGIAADILASTLQRGQGGSAAGTPSSATPSGGGASATLDREKIVLGNGTGATRVDVSTWVMRAWASGVEYLSVGDQVECCGRMAQCYGGVGWGRKHAFFVRQMALLVGSLVRSGGAGAVGKGLLGGVLVGGNGKEWKLGSVSEEDEEKGEEKDDGEEKEVGEGRKGSGLVECMKKVAVAFRVGLDDLPPDEDWMDEYQSDDDLPTTISSDPTAPTQPSKRIRTLRLRHGWPALQVDVLKETIGMSESVGDYTQTIHLITHLLRRLHPYLSKEEQTDLMTVLQGVVVSLRGARRRESDAPVVVFRGGEGKGSGGVGVPILRGVECVRQTQRKQPIPHPKSTLFLGGGSGEGVGKVKDPFLYNPFEKKAVGKEGAEPIILVADEPAYFDITLANPFEFDLEVQSLVLATTGPSHTPTPISTLIPALSRSHTVRAEILPSTSGTLTITGVIVRLFNSYVEEVILPIKRVVADRKSKTGWRESKGRPQGERERFGKGVVEFLGGGRWEVGGRSGGEVERGWELGVRVVGRCPILQGERTTFTLTLQNISDTPINFLTISFLETYAPAVAAAPVETAEAQYERDVYERGLRVLWYEKGGEGEERVVDGGCGGVRGEVKSERVEIEIGPGGRKEVVVGVFGKRGCTGGTITLEYGYLTPQDLAPPSDSSLTSPSTETPQPPDPNFYTRRLLVPLVLTVQPALRAMNMDVLLFPASLTPGSSEARQLQGRNLSVEECLVVAFGGVGGGGVGGGVGGGGGGVGEGEEREWSLFTFDLRNGWGHAFEVGFEVFNGGFFVRDWLSGFGDLNSTEPTDVSRTIIHSGVTKRIVLPLKRLYLPLDTTMRPIPTPEWKQFVVGKTHKLSGEEERAQRECFWYREAVVGGCEMGVGRVRAWWRYSKDCTGTMSLRSLHLSTGMLGLVKKEEVSFYGDVAGVGGGGEGVVERVGSGRFGVRVGEAFDLKWRVVNRKDIPIRLKYSISLVVGAGSRLCRDAGDDIAGAAAQGKWGA
ncbi:hypothetical protein HDV00_002069 [Rhizophlyctis rosea]|nr:hypothetical protein HDV00_002069 [Rhizophlyctis rosea]